MANKRLTELNAIVTPTDDDLIYSVTDVSTTPTSKKSTWTVIKAFLNTYFSGIFLKLDQTTHQHIINGRPVFDQGLELGLTPTVGTHVNGKMFWDATFKTPAFELEDDVTLQIGQETMTYVYNGTGSAIANGKVVYTAGTKSGVPSVALAQGDVDATSQVLGVITSTSIDPGAYGYATVRGHVNGLDTLAWNLNDNLYLDASVAGMLTNVKPNTGDYDTRVARVMLKDAVNGRIYVNIVREYKVGAISAGSGVEMFPDDTIITASGTQSTYPIKTLSKVPVTTTEDVDTITMNNSSVMYGTYLNVAPIGKTSIAGGVWTFDIWAGVSSATNVTSLSQVVLRVRPGVGTITTTGTETTRTAIASTGTPFATTAINVGGTLLTDSFLQTATGLFRILSRVSNTEITIETPTTYTNQTTATYSTHKALFSVNTGEINNVATVGTPWTGLQLYTVTTVQGAFTVEATDTLASSFIGTSTGARSVYFSHNGTTRYSHFTTPLVTSHNDLSGLNDGNYVHLTTTQVSALHGVNNANTTSNSYADGKVEDSIVDGHTTVAPSGNAVFDALALKAPLASPTFTGTVTLADNARIDLTLPTTDTYVTGNTTDSFASGYTASAWNLVFLGSSSKWLEVDANAVATCKGLIGIALEAKNDTEAMKVALPGSFVRYNTWNWTVGATLYASGTLGGISETIPTGADSIIRVIGFAVNADTIFFMPSSDQQSTVA